MRDSNIFRSAATDSQLKLIVCSSFIFLPKDQSRYLVIDVIYGIYVMTKIVSNNNHT